MSKNRRRRMTDDCRAESHKSGSRKTESWKKVGETKDKDKDKKSFSCKHWRQEVELLDGVTVRASSHADRPNKWFSDIDTGTGEVVPDIGVYFDNGWINDYVVTSPGFKPPPQNEANHPWATDVVYFGWTDHGVPHWPSVFLAWAKWIYGQAKSGKTVDFGCVGGHGRTGTALAIMLVCQGMTPGRAIEKIRTDYCWKALEGDKQFDFVVAAYEKLTGHKVDPLDTEEAKVFKEEKAKKRYESTYKYEGSTYKDGKPTGGMYGSGVKKPGFEPTSEKCSHGVWLDYICTTCALGNKVHKQGASYTNKVCKHFVFLDYVCEQCEPDAEELKAAKKVPALPASTSGRTETGSARVVPIKKANNTLCACGHPYVAHYEYEYEDKESPGRKTTAWWCVGDEDLQSYPCDCTRPPDLRNQGRKDPSTRWPKEAI